MKISFSTDIISPIGATSISTLYKGIVFLISFLILFPLTSTAQFWMQSAGGLTIDEAYDIAIDAQGNSYTTGYFSGTSTFGATSLVASGSTDIFITKTNNQGVFQWAVKAGGTGSERANAIAVDASGNVYITGYFNGTATFGTVSLTSSGVQDAFIAKYNSSGTVQWAKKAGGIASDIGFGICVNSTNEVFVTGSFKATATFGSTTLTGANSTSDIFITKLNSTGVFQWSKKGTGNFANTGKSIGCDNAGNVYVVGQFSDTLTFDTQHNNQMQNISFIVKYNNTGSEQWFTKLTGSSSSTINDISVDGSGNIYLTGDFSGTLTYYNINNTVNTSTIPTLTYNFFYTSMNASGAWQSFGSSGSSNAVSAQTVTHDASGTMYIGGYYNCTLDGYNIQYGASTFNAVGGTDVFVSKLNLTSGTWSRSMGGRGNDACYGIAVNSSGEVHVAGSYENALNVPVSSRFLATNLSLWSSNTCATNANFCSDPDYGNFYQMTSSGNKDIFMANSMDPLRKIYDYFERSGTGCDLTIPGVCIDSLCTDTIYACDSTTLRIHSKVCSSVGPDATYLWSTGSTDSTIHVGTSGIYTVTETLGGCLSTVDSVYVSLSVSPPVPFITDSKMVNNQSQVTTAINLCLPDTVTVTASNFNTSLSYWWDGPGLGAGLFDSTFTTSISGVFNFHVMGVNGCEVINTVTVRDNPVLPQFQLAMKTSDTFTLCFPDPFRVQLYDSISNPNGGPGCFFDPDYAIFSSFTVTPTIPFLTTCETYADFSPTTTGTYVISATAIRFNACYRDTFTVSRTIYVTVNPTPILTPFPISISGPSILCPGDSISLAVTGGPNYVWSGPGVYGATDSVVTINQAGQFSVRSTKRDTNAFGCTAELFVTTSATVTLKPQPVITASATVICPNSSILLTSNQAAGNSWEGPNGPIAGGSSISVTDPGQYFTVVSDADSCGLVSNTITLFQYTTPSLVASGNPFICAGDSSIISVSASDGSVIAWQAPLSGNALTQVVYAAGTYTCKITSCGIETFASITINSGSPKAQIVGDTTLCANTTAILSGLPGLASYLWMPGNDTTPSITINQAGTYTLSIVDSNGCSGTDSITVVETNGIAFINSKSTQFCQGDSLKLAGNAGMATYLWSPTNEITADIVVTQPGTYNLQTTDSNGCVATATPITLTQADTFTTVTQNGPSLICQGDTVFLTSSSTQAASYNWLPDSITTAILPVTATGKYWLAITDTSGCIATSDTFNISVKPNNLTVQMLSNDTTVCSGTALNLTAKGNPDSVYWYQALGQSEIYFGNTLSTEINQTTTFYVQVASAPCYSAFDSVTVTTEDCKNPVIPNVFTPNGDGTNDYFQISILDITCFNVKIFNRWGVLIYELISPEQSWDGRIINSPKEAADGVYYYILDYCTLTGEGIRKNGYITLRR
tara:strand:+ start:4351 stop:8619 length:4269 start_codon:yes stop_codon:yes gene_type:complete